METTINYLAILAAGVFSMVLGFVWYSPNLFIGRAWVRGLGKTDAELETMKKNANMGATYAIMFAGSLLMAYVMARFAVYLGTSTLVDGAALGFWLWLGFMVTSGIGTVLFEGRPRIVFIIGAGYHLVLFMVTGVILALWR